MFSALFSFLGGSVFRMVWGEVSTWITAKQDHAHEIEKMKLQGDIDAKIHAQNMEALRVQSELGIKEVQVRSVADLANLDADGFYSAIKAAEAPSGIQWVDGWNKSIRPLCATICIALWVLGVWHNNLLIEAFDMELICTVLGFYFADRTLGKRGK
jgi:hypothetical protein